jgi:hypothetical protein
VTKVSTTNYADGNVFSFLQTQVFLLKIWNSSLLPFKETIASNWWILLYAHHRSWVAMEIHR